MSCNHRAPYWTAAPRCTGCGHRQADANGTPPRQTREYLRSPWTWPLTAFEVAGRIEARIRGRLARTGRLPL